MTSPTIPGRLVLNLEAHERPGDFSFPEDRKSMLFSCPCGQGYGGVAHVGSVNFDPAEGRPLWAWDGNEEAPTITPSILVSYPKTECWHGYLRAGKWEGCHD